ncbi:MAG: ERCC4 domain-containing protein [Promethearchaeia archaeon]
MQSDIYGNVPDIVIDVHETKGKRKNAVKHLMSMLDKEEINYTVEKLPIGDVLGTDGIAIERKTVNDLVHTLTGSKSGVPRLKKQMEALLEYKQPYLLIENLLAVRRDPMKGCVYIPFSSKKTKKKGGYYVTMERASFIHPNSLDGLIGSIRNRGIEILEGFNALHSAGLLFGILDEQDRDEREVTRLPVIRTRKGLDSMSDEQEFFVAGFPNINAVRAKQLLEKFGSPFEVVTRTDEWGEVHGIGPKTVEGVRKMLFSSYEPEKEDTP